MTLDERINEKYSQLSKTDFNVLNYIIANKEKVVEMSVDNISSKAYVSSASIVRLAKKLGFSGFSEMKYLLKDEMQEDENTIEESVNLLKKDIKDTIKLASQTNLSSICEVIQDSDRIFVYGTDWGEKFSASYLVRNFMACDIFMYDMPSVTEMNWTANKLNSKDLVIIFSYSGEGENTKQLISQLNVLGVPIISVTPLTGNFLSAEANYRLYYKTTHLDKEENSNKEFNFFTSLNVLVDFLFRYYYDNFYVE